jgi:aminoglycoside/choline kinase family phosphotransferase
MMDSALPDVPATPGSTAAHDARREQLAAWLASLPPALGLQPASLRPASSDASFRRYFRLDCSGPGRPASLIAMDAPPSHEDCRPFVRVAALLAQRGVHTPEVFAQDLAQGFLLLADLGGTTYADALQADATQVPALYADALQALVRLQCAGAAPDAARELPPYDRARLLAEMQLFPEWYLARHLKAPLDEREQQALARAFDALCAAALGQAQVLVHRDYHCRNLMRVDAHTPAGGANPGVLDFQDAVFGPITYDLVSLLRDAYVAWPEAQQIDWAARYWDLARAAGLPVPARFDEFWRDLEWMGLQRSLKILGIFCRLCYRDGKTRYLGDLPVVLRHARLVAGRYDALAPLARLLDRVHGRPAQAGYTF